MSIEEAKKLVKELTSASINHYAAVNFITKRSPEKTCKAEAKAIWKVLTALTDSQVSLTDVEEMIKL